MNKQKWLENNIKENDKLRFLGKVDNYFKKAFFKQKVTFSYRKRYFFKQKDILFLEKIHFFQERGGTKLRVGNRQRQGD